MSGIKGKSGVYKRTEEQKRKTRKTLKRKGIKPPWSYKGMIPWNKGKKMPKGMSEKIRTFLTGKYGKKSRNWKGGITLLANIVRKCFKYRQWRSDIFTRDDFTCQKCGVRGGCLEAHHNKPFSQILEENNIKTLEEALNCEELWNINNGITFCENCHKN